MSLKTFDKIPELDRRAVCCFAPVLFLSLPTAPAFAHRLTTTETRVDIKRTTGKVEVVHTFHTHDTETALFDAGVIEKADLTLLRPRAQMALYVEKTFELFENGKAVPLKLLGAEFEKRNVYTYQEGMLKTPFQTLSVSASMMRPLIKNQINNVDVYIDGQVTSLQFRGADERKNILA